MDKYIYDNNNGLWHELQGDHYIPCLTIPEEEKHSIGIWGAAQETVQRPSVTVLLVSGLLFLDHSSIIGSAFLNPYQLFSSRLLSFNHPSLLSLELFHLLHKKFRFFSICDEIYTH